MKTKFPRYLARARARARARTALVKRGASGPYPKKCLTFFLSAGALQNFIARFEISTRALKIFERLLRQGQNSYERLQMGCTQHMGKIGRSRQIPVPLPLILTKIYPIEFHFGANCDFGRKPDF